MHDKIRYNPYIARQNMTRCYITQHIIDVPIVFLKKVRNDKGRERGGEGSLVIFRIANQKNGRSSEVHYGLTTSSSAKCTSSEGVVGEQNKR